MHQNKALGITLIAAGGATFFLFSIIIGVGMGAAGLYFILKGDKRES